MRITLSGSYIAAELFEVAQDKCYTIQQHHRRLGRSSSPRMALKQLDAKLLFKQADLTAECGLRDMQGGCRPPKMPLLSEDSEVSELAEIQGGLSLHSITKCYRDRRLIVFEYQGSLNHSLA
jgi:hypothetical protein